MKKFLLPLLLLFASGSFAQTDSVTQRIFLVGDAGELFGADGSHPLIDWLRRNVNWNDSINTAIFLGDNIYPYGMAQKGEADYLQSRRTMDTLLSPFIDKKGRAFFIPGNHDWENGKLGGWQRVINQHNYINGLAKTNIESLPTGGCPGPIVKDLNSQVAVVFIDSQWFLYIHDKPGASSSCNTRTIEEFSTELQEIVATHQNQLLLIVTHHPIYSFGPHGGDYTWKEHLFPLTALNKNLWIPLPVIGSIYPITRGVFGNLQDIKHPLYQTMARAIEDAIRKHPNALIASGHDHSQQFIARVKQKDTIFQIVSGAASKISQLKENKEGTLLFQDLNYGVSVLEVHKSGRTVTKFYNLNSADLASANFVRDFRTIAAPPAISNDDSIPVFPDSVLAAANADLYPTRSRNFFLGENYRSEWITPVKAPVLDLGVEMGGLEPTRQGGGKQTRSLRVVDSTGKEWALRSVEKYPEAAIPPDLRRTFVRDIVFQGVSAAYPFAALSVEPLAKAAGVPYKRKKLVYIPDDPRLSRFRSTFKNTLAIMEERMPEGLEKDDNTDEVVLALAEDNDDHIDQLAVLKARLLDNFYMDFDRHEGQWDWATRDTGKGKIYYPIPKDQDQAFFTNQGLLPRFTKKPWVVPELQGFDKKAENINTFNKPARNFDRFFLNELNRETWSQQIDSFLLRMTDSVIEEALMRQPNEIRQFHYDKLVKTLKERRKYFKIDMLKYYDFLSEEVNIVGSNKHELFTIAKLPQRKVQVTIHKLDKEKNISSKIYDRVFDERITKQLMIYGLEGRDSFVVKGGRTTIKIRLIGGPGDDYFVNESNRGKKVLVYDVDFEENRFGGNVSGFKMNVSGDPRNNEYSRIFYRYGYTKPGLSVAYNVDDGIFVGARAEILTHGFRKEPFSQLHVIRAGHALRTSSYFFNYAGDFTGALGLNDLLVRGDIRAPVNVTNFFGLGNNTTYDPEVGGRWLQYYRARYSLANVSVLLRRRLQSWMNVSYGPTLQYFHVDRKDNAAKFLGSQPLAGVDETTLYDRKVYAGGEVRLDISSRNSENLPTRGFLLDAGIRQLIGLNESSRRLTQLHWDMSVIASFKPQPRVMYALRLGVGHNIGAYEIPQAHYLSGTENLRGFRRNRFAGRTMLYQNTEIRVRLAEFNTYLFPGYFGLLAFSDVGRVWVDHEQSRRWHHGFGGGIWIAPIKRVVLTATLAHSKEEDMLPYLSVGFRF